MDFILDVLKDAGIDTLKLIPFLFLTYLLMEYLEHRTSDKIKRAIKNAGRPGPLIGGLLGAVPQCGFSAAASSLYAGKIITLGTLIAIYLSTSDEMLPILISAGLKPVRIVGIILTKVVYGVIVGFVIDLIFREKATRIHPESRPDEPVFHDLCVQEKCGCDEGVLVPAIKHTLQITLFVLVINIILNAAIGLVPEEALKSYVLNNGFLAPVIGGLIGLIPNCAASVALTQMATRGMITLGGMMAGLFAGAGVGWMVLLRAGRDKKETLKVIVILYVTGVLGGYVCELLAHVFGIMQFAVL